MSLGQAWKGPGEERAALWCSLHIGCQVAGEEHRARAEWPPMFKSEFLFLGGGIRVNGNGVVLTQGLTL